MKNKVAVFRKDARLSQEELAKIIGITRTYLSEIERGKKVPGADIAKFLCIVLEVPFEVLFCA